MSKLWFTLCKAEITCGPFVPVAAIFLLCAAPAAGQVGCEGWASPDFFRNATVDKVTSCLEAGADPNARDEGGGTPLHAVAASSRKPDIVAALIAAGADPNARDDAGNTPLHAALSNKYAEVVLKLLELGADPAARNDEGRVAGPAHCGNWSSRAFAGVADAGTVAGCIESGWDVNVRGAEGDTPLHQAVRAQDSVMVALLLNAGADPGAANDAGATALLTVSENPSWGRILPEARDSGAAGTPDTTPRPAVRADPNAAIVALLLEAGADPNARDPHPTFGGGTLLHWASERGDVRVIELLARAGVDAGADIHARDLQGRTPLHRAAARGYHPAIIVSLLAAGADLGARDLDGNTPLHASWSNFNPEIPSTLLQLGADPMARNDEGRPADPTNCENMGTKGFARAADADDLAGCVDSGRGVNARDSDGDTPLHHAVDNGDLAMVIRLLDAGADVNAAGRWGTPLHGAVERGDTAMIRVLGEAGANPDARNDQGGTPLACGGRVRRRQYRHRRAGGGRGGRGRAGRPWEYSAAHGCRGSGSRQDLRAVGRGCRPGDAGPFGQNAPQSGGGTTERKSCRGRAPCGRRGCEHAG